MLRHFKSLALDEIPVPIGGLFQGTLLVVLQIDPHKSVAVLEGIHRRHAISEDTQHVAVAVRSVFD